jgi:type I restriction enzyme, R subunit
LRRTSAPPTREPPSLAHRRGAGIYDALAENGSAKALMAHEQLRVLTQVLTQTIHSSATIDWTRKDSVRAKMRIEVRKLLARYGYPPDLQKAPVDLVVGQAETLAAGWG